jgi:hypothetical protein
MDKNFAHVQLEAWTKDMHLVVPQLAVANAVCLLYVIGITAEAARTLSPTKNSQLSVCVVFVLCIGLRRRMT